MLDISLVFVDVQIDIQHYTGIAKKIAPLDKVS